MTMSFRLDFILTIVSNQENHQIQVRVRIDQDPIDNIFLPFSFSKQHMAQFEKKHRLLLIGVGIGIAYGLITRLVIGESATMASVTYLFLIPTILGMIPLMFTDEAGLRSYRNIIFIPWLTVATFFFTMYILGIEDMMCLLILGVPFFALGTLGALIFRLIQLKKKRRNGELLSFVLLPFVLVFAENNVQTEPQVYHIHNEVMIDSTPSVIWDHIAEVSPISESEYESGLFHWLGIPRPISATVDKRGVGGKRTGNFEAGLTFVETITEYEENEMISFHIEIDPATVRQKVFDQHVLKGSYFTFVDAAYRLIPQADGQVKLILSSSYQLNSTINFYGKFWGDLILSDFQERLLAVIEKRCEHEVPDLKNDPSFIRFPLKTQ